MLIRVQCSFEYTVGSNKNKIEFLWVLPKWEGFKLDNVLFYVRGILFGDKEVDILSFLDDVNISIGMFTKFLNNIEW